MSELRVELSDSAREGRVVPEVTHFNMFHEVGHPDSVIGLSFVVRYAGREFTLFAHEGVADFGTAMVPVQAYRSGDRAYQGIIESRHEQLAELQTALLAVAPQVTHILDHINS